MSALKVGFIGIGNMGGLMSANLLAAGFPLCVHDGRKQAAESLLERGALWFDSPREIAERVEVICTSLPGPSEMESVTLGKNGILEGIHSGLTYIDFSTNAPTLVRKVHDKIVEKGGKMLDAPVSGGVEGARSKKLSVQVGGDPQVLEEVRPVFEAISEKVIYVGEIGAGSICKLMHNCAVFCANLAMVECFTAGIKAGVDAKTLVDVFQDSGIGRNHDLQVSLPASLFQGNFEPRFNMKTALKDMKLATDLAREYRVPMNLAQLCESDMTKAIEEGLGDKDHTVFLTLQEDRAGVEVRTS